jgi:hypothetical protein
VELLVDSWTWGTFVLVALLVDASASAGILI